MVENKTGSGAESVDESSESGIGKKVHIRPDTDHVHMNINRNLRDKILITKTCKEYVPGVSTRIAPKAPHPRPAVRPRPRPLPTLSRLSWGILSVTFLSFFAGFFDVLPELKINHEQYTVYA
jgi:hypothetical protein